MNRMAIEGQSTPLSVNLHFTSTCNYKCKFCFARFEDQSGSLSTDDWLAVLDELWSCGVRKVNFAGGEPTLSRDLPLLVNYAKALGMTTGIISNGAGITPQFLDACGDSIDVLGVSIDSCKEAVQQAMGRGTGNHVARCIDKALMARARGITLKLNTVVTALNWQEDFSPVLDVLRPGRWKVFQVLLIQGENDAGYQAMKITGAQFQHYIARHAPYNPVAESNDVMEDSYCMINPCGNIYQNTGNVYVTSEPVLVVGFKRALQQVGFDRARFTARGGDYFTARSRTTSRKTSSIMAVK